MRGLLLIILATACATLARADGWTKGPDDDNRQVWILEDAKSGGTLQVGCWQPRVLRIRTAGSLIEMADGDGEIQVAFVASGPVQATDGWIQRKTDEERQTVDGWLLPDSRGVRLKDVSSGTVVKWLQRKENIGRDVTFVLSNNSKREAFTFRNATRVCDGL